jgi:hypothetical protein
MVSLSSCAWLSVLKPALCQPATARYSPRCLRTFVAVDEGILDNHRAPVRCGELLGLSARLPEAVGVPDLVVGAHAARYAQHMAG